MQGVSMKHSKETMKQPVQLSANLMMTITKARTADILPIVITNTAIAMKKTETSKTITKQTPTSNPLQAIGEVVVAHHHRTEGQHLDME